MIPRAASIALAAPVVAAGALLLSAGVAFAAPQTLNAPLSGSNEVPPGDAGLTGTATITVDPNNGQVCARVKSNVKGAVAMHIHKGTSGVNGPVVVPLDPKNINGGNACVAAKSSLAKAIAADPAGYYVNIHTPAKPAGALRGQLASSGSTGSSSKAPRGANAGSGGQAGTPTPGTNVVLVALVVAGAGLVGGAGWRLVRR